MISDETRRKGRPDHRESQALIARILHTATHLFKQQGYAATSIEQIASVAGSGKQTIYRRFNTKEQLFQAVMDSRIANVAERVKEVAEDADPLQALRNTTKAMFDHMMSAESIAFQRVLIAEAARFPALVGRTFDQTIGPYIALTVAQLRAAMATGQLRSTDPERLVGHLTGLVTGWPHQQALLGREVLGSSEARSEYFDAAWTLFLAATKN